LPKKQQTAIKHYLQIVMKTILFLTTFSRAQAVLLLKNMISKQRNQL